MEQHKHGHIRNRFILFFILVAVPPLIFLGLVASWSVVKTRAANVAELESQLVFNIGTRLEKFVLDRVETMTLHVSDPGVTNLALVPEETRANLLVQLLGTEEGKQLKEIAMIDMKGMGIVRVPGKPSVTTQSFADTEGFRAIMKGNLGYYSPVVFTEKNEPVMTLAAPIYDQSGVLLIGVMMGRINLSFAQTLLTETTLGKNGYLYVVNQDSAIVAYSRESPRDLAAIGKRITYPASIMRSVLSGIVHSGVENGDRYKNIRGEPVFAAGLPLRLPPNAIDLGIAVIAEWPEHDALEVVRTIQRQIVLFTLSTFGLILFASLFLARQITKPIEVLREGATVIGSGKFDHRISVVRHDELHELAESFNEMGGRLKELDELKTIRIRSEALAEALKKEQELSHQKDVFISVMSHQLRTPLTAMQWDMEYLLGEAGKPELATYADSIKDAAESSQQITAIVDDLLTVSELGIGYTVKKTEPVDVSATVRELGSVFDRRAKEKKLVYTTQLPEAPLVVDANPNDMRKVFINLLDNAIIYTKEGSVVVSGKDEGESVSIVVTDTGIGIPVTEQKDVFREFFRATNAIVGKNVGTGLGLFIVKTIVEGHGGKVNFTSEEKKGTVFTVTLPKKQKANNS